MGGFLFAELGTNFSVMAEIEWPFDGEDVNWHYCNDNATFSHKEACEFIIHCGDRDFINNRVEEMKQHGCTEDFIKAYQDAANAGAVRVLFYA